MSALAHVPIVLAAQLIGWGLILAGVDPLAVCGLLAVFAGFWREATQAEYRWIEASPNKLRRFMPWYEGLLFWKWNRHSIVETVWTVVTVVVCAVAKLVGWL